MNTVMLTSEQLDKLLTHIESMIEISEGDDLTFYQNWLNTILNK